jgi:hypothetical protein
MDTKLLKKRADVFLEQKQATHITTNDDSWLNGYILKTYDDYLVFLDRKRGRVTIFFVDIRKLDFFNGDVSTLKNEEKKDGKRTNN